MENDLKTRTTLEEDDSSFTSSTSPGRRSTDPIPEKREEGGDFPSKEGEIPLDPDDEDPLDEGLPDSETWVPESDEPVVPPR